MKTYPTINKNTISKPDLIVNNPTKPNSPKSLIYFTSIGSFFFNALHLYFKSHKNILFIYLNDSTSFS